MQAWLVRVAHRKVVDQHRARARRSIPIESLPESTHADGRNAEVWEALAELPERQRLAVVHHHLAGLPHAEIAGLLGNSEAAARRAAADGIRALRRIFIGHPDIGHTKTDRASAIEETCT